MRYSTPLLAISAALLLAGCGGNTPESTNDRGRAQVNIEWPERTRLIPVASESITISFESNDQTIASQTIMRPTMGNSSTVSFTDLPAANLVLRAEAFPNNDGTGVQQARAVTNVTIVANTQNPLAITMDTTILAIEITPETASLQVNDTIQLNASALDGLDRIVMVSPQTTTWTSSRTGVATVDQNGLVTAVGAGSAVITFTESESGLSDTIRVEVSSTGTP